MDSHRIDLITESKKTREAFADAAAAATEAAAAATPLQREEESFCS